MTNQSQEPIIPPTLLRLSLGSDRGDLNRGSWWRWGKYNQFLGSTMFHTPFAVIREDEVRFLSANRGCHQAALFWHMSPPSLLAGDILGITHIG